MTETIDTIVARRPSKEDILLVAEELFADRSIDGVSFREIAAAAGYRSPNAVQYHFENRNSLIESILKYRLSQMDPIRTEDFSKFVARGEKIGTKELFYCLCKAVLSLRSPTGRRSFPKFMTEYLTRLRPAGFMHPTDIDRTVAPVTNLLAEALHARLPTLSPEDRGKRVITCYMMFLLELVSWDTDPSIIGSQTEQDRRFNDVLDMMVAAFEAPVTEPGEFLAR